jgi:sec-independent protein translocase protein TatA
MTDAALALGAGRQGPIPRTTARVHRPVAYGIRAATGGSALSRWRSITRYRSSDMLSGIENPTHWLVLLVVVLLVFGPRRLPEMGKSLGSGIRQFREGIQGPGATDHGEQVGTSPDERA